MPLIPQVWVGLEMLYSQQAGRLVGGATSPGTTQFRTRVLGEPGGRNPRAAGSNESSV